MFSLWMLWRLLQDTFSGKATGNIVAGRINSCKTNLSISGHGGHVSRLTCNAFLPTTCPWTSGPLRQNSSNWLLACFSRPITKHGTAQAFPPRDLHLDLEQASTCSKVVRPDLCDLHFWCLKKANIWLSRFKEFLYLLHGWMRDIPL